MKNQKGITLIALVITIIVLLILAGITLASLTGTNGLVNRANNAKIETAKAAAKEKVQVAVVGSFSEDEIIDNAWLKKNLDKVEGIENVPETITDEEFTLTVKVDGYEVEIEKNGKVTLKGEKSEIGSGTETEPPKGEGGGEEEPPKEIVGIEARRSTSCWRFFVCS